MTKAEIRKAHVVHIHANLPRQREASLLVSQEAGVLLDPSALFLGLPSLAKLPFLLAS